MCPLHPTQHLDLTGSLREWLSGNGHASDAVMDVLGNELSAIARRIVSRQPPGNTLQATALLNEFWLKIAQSPVNGFRDRQHFMVLAVTTMRRIVVDHARQKRALKRSPQGERIEFEALVRGLEARSRIDLVELDDALSVLGEEDPEALKVIELRFFGGLTIAETAELLGCTGHRVRSEEVLACKRLARLMS